MLEEHIESSLNSYLCDSVETIPNSTCDFEPNFNKIILYIDKLLDECYFKTSDEIQPLHLHFAYDFSETEQFTIAQYLLEKLFKIYHENDVSGEINKSTVKLKLLLDENKKKLITAPPKASGLKGGNKAYKDWIEERESNERLVEFYSMISDRALLKNRVLFNTLVSFGNQLKELYQSKPLLTHSQSPYSSYIWLNADCTLNELNDLHPEVIEDVEFVVLYNLERKRRIMETFSYETLNSLREEIPTASFGKYLVLTFGDKANTIRNIRDKLLTISDKSTIARNSSYTVLPCEVNYLLGRSENNNETFIFVGPKTSIYWYEFLKLASIYSLYELKSIKMLNIYTLCLNSEIKDYILNEIFKESENSELISHDTKRQLLDLTDEDTRLLKDNLSMVLNLIIENNLNSELVKTTSSRLLIILDEAILNNRTLFPIISKSLFKSEQVKFGTWADLEKNSSFKEYLIISYRDQGKYPNYFYPNLLELKHFTGSFTSILQNFLFSKLYEWANYRLYNEYHKALCHPIREKYFEWAQLKANIYEIKPRETIDTNWDLENEYSHSGVRDIYKVEIKGHKVKTFEGSELFILSDDNENYKVRRVDEIFPLDASDSAICAQNLAEIQESINLFEKIAKSDMHNAEFEAIKKNLNLEKLEISSPVELWKSLLRLRADECGEDALYKELQQFFLNKNLKLVSRSYFEHNWINPRSDIFAPVSKRVFQTLCEYLRIDKTYYAIVQRLRNASKQSSRHSTTQMNNLLKELFNQGCFDMNKHIEEIIDYKYYKSRHQLDEIGINESYFKDGIVALVDLIKPELKLSLVKKIERVD